MYEKMIGTMDRNLHRSLWVGDSGGEVMGVLDLPVPVEHSSDCWASKMSTSQNIFPQNIQNVQRKYLELILLCHSVHWICRVTQTKTDTWTTD